MFYIVSISKVKVRKLEQDRTLMVKQEQNTKEFHTLNVLHCKYIKG